MKLKHRLSLYAIIIFSVITVIISSVIYISFYALMDKKEKQSLENKSLLAAIYYLEKDELPLLEHENIKTQLLKTISRRNIVVFDSLGQHFGGEMDTDTSITHSFIAQVRAHENVFFETAEYFYNGIFYRDNQGDFVVITRQTKDEFKNQVSSLLHILIAVSILGIGFIYFFSQYLGNIAYDPLLKIIEQIKDRDAKNFMKPISVNKSYAEVEDLVSTYNHFVDRLAQTFNVQKNFIDYVSHELRTPITALLGTMEVTHQKPRSTAEYEDTIRQLKQYTNDLQETLDHMMLLSGAKTNFEFKPVRVDEVVWQVIENAILYHKAQIEVDIQVADTNILRIYGNDKLLELAIGNILHNAIKYSNNSPVKVLLTEEEGRLCIRIIDTGIGILTEDLQYIMGNFVRGQNTQRYQGKGVGLSIANIIFNLHKIKMSIQSSATGTEVLLLL
ncbi:sensor histidine kinase [Sphingobacterium sp. Mn56C]|uniref:sensor histidine kinase n=1 Tax=Sphingobacterium sp. Mn56C TaxID=3395261 RepID=UPI003BE4B380